MQNARAYGNKPYTVAVVHGGPGAAGEMAPVARELAKQQGILEPLLTANNLECQVQELRAALNTYAAPPITLIGYSWGAWLSWMVTARYPALVRKLILLSSGPFEECHVAKITNTRLQRLTESERQEWQAINIALDIPDAGNMDALLARLRELAFKADSFDPLPQEDDPADRVDLQSRIYFGVWETAAQMRRDGTLLELAEDIRCPVIAIHGDYDPHPAEGVREPLSARLKDFYFTLLKNCGHSPWMEKQARERFFEVVRRELG